MIHNDYTHAALRQRHLKHEQAIKSIAGMQYIGVAGLVGMGVYFAAFAPEKAPPPVLIFFLGFAILLLISAIGVHRLQPWGRVLCCLIVIPGIFMTPIVALMNLYVLYMLLCRKGETIFSKEYRVAIAHTPHIKPPSELLKFIVLFILVILLLIAVVFPGVFLG